MVMFPELFLTTRVKKYNKRLYIEIIETGELYYTPPDFIREKMNSRKKLVDLSDRLSYIPFRDWIDEIMKFEFEMHKGRLV